MVSVIRVQHIVWYNSVFCVEMLCFSSMHLSLRITLLFEEEKLCLGIFFFFFLRVSDFCCVDMVRFPQVRTPTPLLLWARTSITRLLFTETALIHHNKCRVGIRSPIYRTINQPSTPALHPARWLSRSPHTVDTEFGLCARCAAAVRGQEACTNHHRTVCYAMHAGAACRQRASFRARTLLLLPILGVGVGPLIIACTVLRGASGQTMLRTTWPTMFY